MREQLSTCISYPLPSLSLNPVTLSCHSFSCLRAFVLADFFTRNVSLVFPQGFTHISCFKDSFPGCLIQTLSLFLVLIPVAGATLWYSLPSLIFYQDLAVCPAHNRHLTDICQMIERMREHEHREDRKCPLHLQLDTPVGFSSKIHQNPQQRLRDLPFQKIR